MKTNKNKYLIVRVTESQKEEYKNLCESLGFTVTKRICALINNDINTLKKLKNE